MGLVDGPGSVELGVVAVERDELLVRTELGEPAVVDDADPVGARRSRAGARRRSSCARASLLHRLLDVVLGAGVEVRRRLVEHEHRRIGERGARDRHQLALAGREP